MKTKPAQHKDAHIEILQWQQQTQNEGAKEKPLYKQTIKVTHK